MNRSLNHRVLRLRAVASCVVTVLTLGFVGARGELLFYEGFNYPVRQELGEAESSAVWKNDKNQFTIVNGSLDYAGLLSSVGNRLNVAAVAPTLDSVRTIDTSWPKQTEGALYISFILRLQSLAEITDAPEGTSLLTLGDTFNNAELFGINLRHTNGCVSLGAVKYSSGRPPVSAAIFFTDGVGANLAVDGATTYFVVAKYEWLAGAADDVVTLWVNPVNLGQAESPTNSVRIDSGLDGNRGVGRLTLSRGPNVNFDEIRIGQRWDEVTPVAERPRSWFPAVAGLLAGLGGAVFWIGRLRRKVAERSAALRAQVEQRQRAERQKLVEQERARIAHDLHDELGGDITELSMLAIRVQDGAEGGEEGRRCLAQMVDKSRQMVAKLEEIVWAMNPEHDSLGDLVSYFSFAADRFLSLANIQLVLDTAAVPEDFALEARVRHQLFLVCKEALTNVVKHARARQVTLSVRKTETALCLVVADDGCGWGPSGAGSASQEGIVSMRRRMESLGGTFAIAGSPGQGTTVKFSVPLKS